MLKDTMFIKVLVKNIKVSALAVNAVFWLKVKSVNKKLEFMGYGPLVIHLGFITTGIMTLY